jgi:hypothetical protein
LFLNQEQRSSEDVKQYKSRKEYFRSYNKLPHRQEYLKECGRVRRLVAKYNSAYQDKRKDDRHKLNRKNRYQLETLKKELNQRD